MSHIVFLYNFGYTKECLVLFPPNTLVPLTIFFKNILSKNTA